MMSENSECPYCGADVPSDYETEMCPVTDADLECPDCGKTYKIRVQPRIHSETWKKEEVEA